jgi:histidine ammonia-lyase
MSVPEERPAVMHPKQTPPVVLDGESLTIAQLVSIARDPSSSVECHPRTDARVLAGEQLIAKIVENYVRDWKSGDRAATEYGVTTGFGEFKDKAIAPDDLKQLQRNLLLSHSVGVGENTDPDDLRNYFSAEVVRGALVTRLNAFLKGHSGVRSVLVRIVQSMLNRRVIPLVPVRGSVGASGDLCPLSHLFSVLLGVGRFYLADERRFREATELPSILGFSREELQPTFKEGLALVNGANFSSSMLALAVHDAEQLARAADENAALALEAVAGCTRALDPKVHQARGQVGQIESASRIRELVGGSRLVECAGAVQDAYSLRCAPQVHGAVRDAIAYARGIAERELNAATDNPLFFPEDTEPFDVQFRANWPEWYRGDHRLAYSAGNFHGEPLAIAADLLAIAVAELASIAERRTQLMLDRDQNRGLPPNLTTRPGVNSGLMIAQYTAASIVSENKVLAHPASVDSIPTGANTEDHVPMSTYAGRKLRTVIGNVQAVLSIERLVASQAIEWRVALIEGAGAARTMEEADAQARAFEAIVAGRSAHVATYLGRGTSVSYLAVRGAAEPVLFDRPLHDDIRSVRKATFEA